MEKLLEISWPDEYLEIRRIEELLKCGICYDFIETSVMTPCSHNYCSLCIRKYLHYKTQCPACFQTTFEKDLHINRIMDEIIVQFIKIRVKLVNCISEAEIVIKKSADVNNKLLNFQPTRPPRTNHCHKSISKVNVSDSSEKASVTDGVMTSDIPGISNKDVLSIPCTSDHSFSVPNETGSNDSKSSDQQVPCPVCQVKISKIHINKHLDECIKRESIPKKESSRNDNDRKLLPKLVFHLMKDSELKKKMKQLNLPTNGDRRTLENRFQRYSTLYNAECDKKEPRSVIELLKQCKDEELMEKKLEKSAMTFNKVKLSKNSEQHVIDEVNQKYLEKNAQSYQTLIESIRNNKQNHKKSTDDAKASDKCTNTVTSNAIQPKKHLEPLSDNSLIFNYNDQQLPANSCNDTNKSINQSTSLMEFIDTKGSNKCQFIWPAINNYQITSDQDNCDPSNNDSTNNSTLDRKKETNMNNLKTNEEENEDDDQTNTNNTEDSFPINNSPACPPVRKRYHHSCENQKKNESEFIVTPNISSHVSSSIVENPHDKDININYTNDVDDKTKSVETEDCTMKRRRQQKQIARSINKEIINPPSRPVRKRDSSTISCDLVISDDT